jgi:two-component SAPR family response regulator
MKIAIIDDNSTTLLLNEIVLKKIVTPEDSIIKFSHLKEIYAEFDRFAEVFDIVICDHNLGLNSTSGFDFLTELKEKNDKVICVLLTSDDSLLLKSQVLFQGDILFVQKHPVEAPKALEYIVNEVRKERDESK